MDNRSIFLYHTIRYERWGDAEGQAQRREASKPVGRHPRQIRSAYDREAMVSRDYGCKASGLRLHCHEKPLARSVCARTANRHRSAGRAYSGGRETPR